MALVDAMAVVDSAFWDVSDEPAIASLPAWFESVERDVAHAFVLMFGAAVRCTGGPGALRPDHPRVPRIVESLVRRAAAAAAVDGA